MLVATRDPMPSPGAHDGSPRPPHVPSASRSSRFMTAMQIAGSVLAIPVGLASAYSVYRANFSVDTTCQTLRANIISMLDKKLDPTTQRMLVRHDVETFEKTCGGVDPDAEAAFKALLSAGQGAPVHSAPVKHAATPVRIEPKQAAKAGPARAEPRLELRAAVPAEPVRAPAGEHAREAAKGSPKPAVQGVSRAPANDLPKDAKAEVKEQAKSAAAIAPLQQHDPAADAQWVDAVRNALTAHSPEQSADAAPVVRGAPPHPLGELPSVPPPPPAGASAGTAPATSAPALPPPMQVGNADRTAAAPAADPDHPVPPGTIPEQTGPAPSGWLSKVPFVGQVLAK